VKLYVAQLRLERARKVCGAHWLRNLLRPPDTCTAFVYVTVDDKNTLARKQPWRAVRPLNRGARLVARGQVNVQRLPHWRSLADARCHRIVIGQRRPHISFGTSLSYRKLSSSTRARRSGIP